MKEYVANTFEHRASQDLFVWGVFGARAICLAVLLVEDGAGRALGRDQPI